MSVWWRRLPALLLSAGVGVAAGCSGGGADGRAGPEEGRAVTVATFEEGFLPRGVGVDARGTVYTSGWDGERFVLVAIPEDGDERRTPIPCSTSVEADQDFDTGMVVVPDGTVYWSKDAQQRVVRIAPDGKGDCFAGTGEKGFSGDGGPALEARLSGPVDLALDPAQGDLYIHDRDNLRIRRVDRAGTITTVVEPTTLPDGRLGGYGPLAFDVRGRGRLLFDEAPIGTLTRSGDRGRLDAAIFDGETGATSLAVDPGSGVLYAGGIGDGDFGCSAIARVHPDGRSSVLAAAAPEDSCADFITADRSHDLWVIDGDRLKVFALPAES